MVKRVLDFNLKLYSSFSLKDYAFDFLFAITKTPKAEATAKDISAYIFTLSPVSGTGAGTGSGVGVGSGIAVTVNVPLAVP